MDVSVLKNFQLHEKQLLQFRFEVFNATNHPNWGLPDTALSDPSFGTIRTTRTDMRYMQAGLDMCLLFSPLKAEKLD
jgi:predicted RNA methylase